MNRHVWNEQKVSWLRRLAAKGLACSEIGEIMGMPGMAIRRKCVKEGIEAVRLTQQEADALAVLAAQADERRNKRRRQTRKPAPRAAFSPLASPTSAAYRRQMYERIPEMTKSQARAMCAEAFRNTAAMPVE